MDRDIEICKNKYMVYQKKRNPGMHDLTGRDFCVNDNSATRREYKFFNAFTTNHHSLVV